MKKVLLIIVIVIIFVFGFVLFKPDNEVVAEETIKKESEKNSINKKEIKKIKVDIKGEIINPNVYEVNEDTRIIDVINIAGGLTENAEVKSINLSKKLNDEDVIIIYQKGEEIITKKDYETAIDNCNKDNNSSCVNGVVSFNNSDNKDIVNNKIVNINKATLDEFLNLAGIGESKAKNIISYREENGNFNDIEEIKKVTGIGDNIFEQIKDFITV